MYKIQRKDNLLSSINLTKKKRKHSLIDAFLHNQLILSMISIRRRRLQTIEEKIVMRKVRLPFNRK